MFKYTGLIESRLPILNAIMKEWVSLNSDTSKAWDGDVPWRYNERAFISFLAGAIWRRGGYVLEEYSTEKLGCQHNSEYFGRGDLWFQLDGVEADVEAKHFKLPLDSANSYSKLITLKFNEAVQDLLKLKVYDTKRVRLAVLNVVPIFDLSKECQLNIVSDESGIKSALNGFIQAVESQGQPCAWVLRDDYDFKAFPDGRNPNYRYPGTALIFSEIDLQ